MPSEPSLPLEIEPQIVNRRLQNGEDLLLVDCREADEHSAAHIPQARLVPMSQFSQRVGELEEHRQRPIVVHCHHGGRSLRVTKWLREQGFVQAQSMAGGIDRWAIEIDPTMPRY
jgi:adenylyltransferase/sulfurtransferase